jgi:hypothetical protein
MRAAFRQETLRQPPGAGLDLSWPMAKIPRRSRTTSSPADTKANPQVLNRRSSASPVFPADIDVDNGVVLSERVPGTKPKHLRLETPQRSPPRSEKLPGESVPGHPTRRDPAPEMQGSSPDQREPRKSPPERRPKQPFPAATRRQSSPAASHRPGQFLPAASAANKRRGSARSNLRRIAPRLTPRLQAAKKKLIRRPEIPSKQPQAQFPAKSSRRARAMSPHRSRPAREAASRTGVLPRSPKSNRIRASTEETKLP